MIMKVCARVFYNSYLKRIKLKSLLFEKVLMSIYTLLHVCAIAMKDMPAKQTGGQAIDKLGHFGSIQCKDGIDIPWIWFTH